MQMVTIFTAYNPMDADLVNSRLEAAEFHPTISQDLSAQALGGIVLGAGGILVQVPEDEAEEAKTFLASSNTPPSA